MSSMLRAAILVVAAGALAPSALANDSTAELATGGLVFTRNDNVEMRSEELAISAVEVSVRYRFFNKSSQDVTVLVAFPMPEIKISGPDENISIPTEDPVNILGFTTVVNGRPVKTEVQQRVFASGVDRTQLLTSLNIPLAPHLRATGDALDRLPKDRWDELVRLGLAEVEEFDAGKGMERHLAARWSLQTTYYWQQTFFANAEIVIEHRYKPSVGASVQTMIGDPTVTKESWFDDYRRKYCMDKSFIDAAARARQQAKLQSGAPFSEQRIEYILKTGANWAGPIRDFRLTVDKGDADSLVSFCGEGVKRISPTRFEMRATDFTPQRDLSILILKRLKQ
jgi:Domain of unknown function (DUF4424)